MAARVGASLQATLLSHPLTAAAARQALPTTPRFHGFVSWIGRE